jgi:hypothetical protein
MVWIGGNSHAAGCVNQGNQYDPPEPKKDETPDADDLLRVVNFVREWGGKLEVDHFSQGKYYHIQTKRLAVSGWNLKEVCQRFLDQTSQVEGG